MKKSLHAKRMERSHRRHNGATKLNLTSLMDIFTILVFFLMVNSSDVQVLESKKAIKLPDSTAQKKPRETLVVMVSGQDILVQGRKVSSIADANQVKTEVIKPLLDELKYQANRSPKLTEEQKKFGRAVTIMGDHKTPYKLLKKIMNTCAEADYRNMSLAVSKKAGEKDAAKVEGA